MKRRRAFLNGKPHVARLILRDLVNVSLGFDALAAETNGPSKRLHRMLSEMGNPSMDNLAAIFGAVRKRLGVAIEGACGRSCMTQEECSLYVPLRLRPKSGQRVI